jgi:hypothetical protein
VGNLAFRSPRESWLIIADDNPASGSDMHASGNNCRTKAEQERLKRSLEERDVSSETPRHKKQDRFLCEYIIRKQSEQSSEERWWCLLRRGCY